MDEIPAQPQSPVPPQPTQTPAQPQAQSNKQGINWKTIIIGVIIGGLVVGIGALVFYQYQSSSDETTSTQVTTPKTTTDSAKEATSSAEKDETAGWKIFTTASGGYSINYPKDWLATNYQEIEGRKVQSQTPCPKTDTFLAPTHSLLGICGTGFGGIIWIGLIPVKPNPSWTGTTLSGQLKANSSENYSNYTYQESKVSGRKVIRISGTWIIEPEVRTEESILKDTERIIYLVDLGEEALMFRYSKRPQWVGNYSDDFDKIFSTLKIL